jgi:anaerobic magnesium-protoporphyrin IX monomethyl ester cyclase
VSNVSPFPILASRGCPYGCEFCSVVLMFGRRVRTIEPVEVVKHIKKVGPKKVFFYDDNFLISKRRGKELLAEMIRQGVETDFYAQIRVDSVCKNGEIDRELLDLLWNAGCRIVYLGLESINPETLKEYHKESSLDDMAGGLEALGNRGIKTHGMFVFGADSDTVESLDKTADYAVKYGLNSAQFLALTPLPGTSQTAQLEAEGRIFTRNWSLYDGFHAVFWPKRMTPYELQEAVMEAHKRFYKVRRIVNPWPKSPRYRKHQVQGYLLAHAWEHIGENREFMRELREFSNSNSAPADFGEGGFRSNLETAAQ